MRCFKLKSNSRKVFGLLFTISLLLSFFQTRIRDYLHSPSEKQILYIDSLAKLQTALRMDRCVVFIRAKWSLSANIYESQFTTTVANMKAYRWKPVKFAVLDVTDEDNPVYQQWRESESKVPDHRLGIAGRMAFISHGKLVETSQIGPINEDLVRELVRKYF